MFRLASLLDWAKFAEIGAKLPAFSQHHQPFKVTARLGERSTAFAEFAALGRETGAVNLGQGFPDSTPPFVQAPF